MIEEFQKFESLKPQPSHICLVHIVVHSPPLLAMFHFPITTDLHLRHFAPHPFDVVLGRSDRVQLALHLSTHN